MIEAIIPPNTIIRDLTKSTSTTSPRIINLINSTTNPTSGGSIRNPVITIKTVRAITMTRVLGKIVDSKKINIITMARSKGMLIHAKTITETLEGHRINIRTHRDITIDIISIDDDLKETRGMCFG